MTLKYGRGGAGEGAGDDSRGSAAERFRRGVLANANRGGENVASGALIGAMLGAQCGFAALPRDLIDGLAPHQRAALDREVDAFVAAVPLADAARL